MLGVDEADKLPAVRWKMQNLERMPEAKHKAELEIFGKSCKPMICRPA